MSTPERLNQFLELNRTGRSSTEIAALMGITTRTVTRWRALTGTSVCGKVDQRPEETRQRALQLLEDGCSFTEAAKTIGVTAQTIRRWFPHVPAWTKQQAGQYARIVHLEREMEHHAA